MTQNFRSFEATDPFGRTWQVRFAWQQNAVSIRHADAVDVKFLLGSGETTQEKVVALPHAGLLALAGKTGRPVTDPWVSRLAASHIRHIIETGEDMDKTLVSPTPGELERYDAALQEQTADH